MLPCIPNKFKTWTCHTAHTRFNLSCQFHALKKSFQITYYFEDLKEEREYRLLNFRNIMHEQMLKSVNKMHT